MMNLCSPTTIRTLMSEAGIRFRKNFGQNFLIDPAVPQRIAQACADDEDTLILEIGPGVGCLTQQLALRYRRVVALEIDAGLIPVLERTVGEFRHVTVYREDVMKADLPALLKQSVPDRQPGIDMTVSVCANLPYYITTPILMRLLTCGINFSAITVMVQKEVADRLTAAPGSRDYGAITAVTGYYGQARKLFTVPAGCFLPAPKVNSAVLRIDLFKQTPFVPKDEGLLFRTIRAAFPENVRFDAETGEQLVSFHLADNLNSSPTIGPDGVIYCNGVLNGKPTLFAVDATSTAPADSWSQMAGSPSKSACLY